MRLLISSLVLSSFLSGGAQSAEYRMHESCKSELREMKSASLDLDSISATFQRFKAAKEELDRQWRDYQNSVDQLVRKIQRTKEIAAAIAKIDSLSSGGKSSEAAQKRADLLSELEPLISEIKALRLTKAPIEGSESEKIHQEKFYKRHFIIRHTGEKDGIAQKIFGRSSLLDESRILMRVSRPSDVEYPFSSIAYFLRHGEIVETISAVGVLDAESFTETSITVEIIKKQESIRSDSNALSIWFKPPSGFQSISITKKDSYSRTQAKPYALIILFDLNTSKISLWIRLDNPRESTPTFLTLGAYLNLVQASKSSHAECRSSVIYEELTMRQLYEHDFMDSLNSLVFE